MKAQLKDILGIDSTGPARRGNAILDFAKEFVPQLMNSPVLAAVLQRAMAPTAPGMNGPPRPPLATTPAGTTPQPENDFVQFVGQTTPALITYLESEAEGGDFAEWIYSGFPDRLPMLQNLSHPSMPGLSGPPVILAFYRQTPFWQRLALHETRFTLFIEEFCKWKPDQENDIQEGDAELEDETPERMEV